MSDKQNKQTLLVEQDEALSFYLDSLLSPQENDLEEELADEQSDTLTGTTQEIREPSLQNHEEPQRSQSLAQERMQSAKEFLQSSRQRLQKQQETLAEIDLQTKAETDLPAKELSTEEKTAAPEPVKEQGISPLLTSPKVITAGPVSPKPREREISSEAKNVSSEPTIVFSETDRNGKVKEQILIPRSQRMALSGSAARAGSDSSAQTKSVAKSIPAVKESVKPPNFSQSEISSKPVREAGAVSQSMTTQTGISESNDFARNHAPEPASDAVTISGAAPETNPSPEKVSAPVREASPGKEAPSLDLSLFLPKIKTLSEEEIAEQIEALTQAAVSQAQLETDLAQAAQLERMRQQTLQLQSQTQNEPDSLIRNSSSAPSWAIPDFQVLLFAVSGLKLAVPLTELNGIVEWGDEYINELPGHAPWYLGLIQNQGKNVPVIDTLQQVVPRNRWPADHLTQRNFKHIILIDNGRWGLACEKVLEVITLKTDSVKWRSSRTKRRWLLGTVIDHMCALLDSSEFAAMLETGDDSLMNE